MNNEQPKFPMRIYTPLQLARVYKVSKPTFFKWLQPFEEAIGKRIGQFYTVTQVKIIVERLGVPNDFDL